MDEKIEQLIEELGKLDVGTRIKILDFLLEVLPEMDKWTPGERVTCFGNMGNDAFLQILLADDGDIGIATRATRSTHRGSMGIMLTAGSGGRVSRTHTAMRWLTLTALRLDIAEGVLRDPFN